MKRREPRGGARPGAGRKPQDKVKLTVTVDRELSEWMGGMGVNKSAVVNTALRRYKDAAAKPPAGN